MIGLILVHSKSKLSKCNVKLKIKTNQTMHAQTCSKIKSKYQYKKIKKKFKGSGVSV